LAAEALRPMLPAVGLADLPLELLHTVLTHVAIPDVLSLAQVSCGLGHLAQMLPPAPTLDNDICSYSLDNKYNLFLH
jgi:hypothetical protein